MDDKVELIQAINPDFISILNNQQSAYLFKH